MWEQEGVTIYRAKDRECRATYYSLCRPTLHLIRRRAFNRRSNRSDLPLGECQTSFEAIEEARAFRESDRLVLLLHRPAVFRPDEDAGTSNTPQRQPHVAAGHQRSVPRKGLDRGRPKRSISDSASHHKRLSKSTRASFMSNQR